LENLKERDLLEDIGVDRRMILKCTLKKRGWESVDWIHVAREREQWPAVLDTVMGLRVP
jgi:hypothetical protein